MSVRALNRQAGTGGLRAYSKHSIDVVFDSDASDKLKFKDSAGVVREVVDTTSTQSLTGKTIAAQDVLTTYTADGAITISPGTHVLNKVSALAMTLAAPSVAQAGTRLTITSMNAAAHVVTATSLVGDGVSGSPHTTMTFAAFIGATIELIAINQIWNEVCAKGVTVT